VAAFLGLWRGRSAGGRAAAVDWPAQGVAR